MAVPEVTLPLAMEICHAYFNNCNTPVWHMYMNNINTEVRPKKDWYFSENNYCQFRDLVSCIGSVQFQDTWCRFRFNFPVYIWNRTALDFCANSNSMSTINLDTFCKTTKTLSVTMPSHDLKIWYFWDNRILTPRWILDFEWNIITAFNYDSITPWDTWVVWGSCGFCVHKWIVNWDSVSFSCIWSWWTDQWAWEMNYWHLWAYLFNNNDISWNWQSTFVNINNNDSIVTIWWQNRSRKSHAVAWADGKMYRYALRCNWWWTLQKVSTCDEWIVWNSLSKSWLAYWSRFGKFLWNVVSWWMNSNNWQGNWYWSNNYFIDGNWCMCCVQWNAFAYDTWIMADNWFIDENWWIYPRTYNWWSWVILKTDKCFTNLNWENPYLWR